MRPAPPSEFRLIHFGLWRGGVAVLVALAAAALAAWWWPMPADPAVTLAAAAAAAATVAAAWLAVRWPACHVRRDPHGWFADLGSGFTGPYRLDVVLDLGSWMLLGLRPAEPRAGLRTVWIPAQRRGHVAEWHGMRRAVYFPRPTVGGPPGVEPHLPE